MMSRRAFVRDLGRGGLAVVVFGLTGVGCAEDDPGPTSSQPGGDDPTTTLPPASTSDPAAVSWERVNLGFVSAYVLERGGEAAIVDTGVPGSESDIEASLGALNLTWGDVGHVIVTHLHDDHQGSLPAVLELAPTATGYAGEADIPSIASPRPLTAVGDNDRVFDLRIITTPGHTPGHISILDEVGGLLVAGDALNGSNGRVIGANPDFTADIVKADESVAKLANFQYDALVFGHGDPVVGNASTLVAELAAAI